MNVCQHHFGLNELALDGQDNLSRYLLAYFPQFFDYRKEHGLTDLDGTRLVSIAWKLLSNFKVI